MGFVAVSKSETVVVERWGTYHCTLGPGRHWLWFWDNDKYRISMSDLAVDPYKVNVVSKDNVELDLEVAMFYRVENPQTFAYNDIDVPRYLKTHVSSLVRNHSGRADLDELQTARESISSYVREQSTDLLLSWGVALTSLEITDVILDSETKAAQRHQLNAERERRAMVLQSEGKREAERLRADAELYAAEQESKKIRLLADSEAYAAKARAEAKASEISRVGEAEAQAAASEIEHVGLAVEKYGQEPVRLALGKAQVEAIGALAASDSSKSLVLPTDLANVFGAISTVVDSIQDRSSAN